MRYAFALAVVGVFLWLNIRRRSRGRRGRTVLSKRQAERRSRDESDGSITWGGVALPKEADTAHFLAVGTTGSGKSLTLNRLMREALEGAAPGGDVRALVYDPKQEVLSFLSSLEMDIPVVTFNAFDKRAVEWDMAADITSPATALQVASILVPEERNSSNRYFSDTARDLLTGVMLSFIASGEPWTLRDVVFTMRSRGRVEEVLSRTGEGLDMLEMHAQDGRAFHNVLSTARSRLAPLEPIAAAWSRAAHKVSLRGWVAGEMVLVLGNDDSARTAMDAINQVLFQRATELVLREPNSWSRRTWFFLDEVREAGKLNGLSRLMNKGRSKGACVALGFQDIHGLKDAYGNEVALEIIGQCSNKVLLRLESGETAEWAAKTVGQFEEVEVLESRSKDLLRLTQRTHSEHRVKLDAVLPSEFLSIPVVAEEGGLTGYFMTPFVGLFRRTLPLQQLLGKPVDPATQVADFIERPESEQYLEPWTRVDLNRLGLSYELLQAREVEPEPLELVTREHEHAM